MPARLTRVAIGQAAAPLPDPFPSLVNGKFGVRFRQGQVVMFAGPPGAGKSTVALIAAIKMGVPTLYVSADSDEDTMAARAAAAITGHKVRDVEATITYGLFRDEYGERLNSLPIRFVFDPSEPSIQDIGSACTAFLESWGVYPKLLVVDNLMNLAGDSDVEVQTQKQGMRHLQWLARKTRACVLVLHHTSEQDENHVQSAPPRRAIQNKVSQLPSLILTMAHKDNEMFVAVVKHRHGLDDPKAESYLRWIVDFTVCRIDDKPMMPDVPAYYGGFNGRSFAP